MRAADGAIVELLCVFVGLTGSHGIAIVLTALVFKLVLLPLDWTQARQIWRTQQAIPVLEHMRRDYTDYRVHRFEVRHLLAARGIKPMLTLGCVVAQVPLFLMAFMVLFGTSALAGQSFLWISDVSLSDRVAQIPAIPWLGSNLNLLPLVLVLSIWILLQTLPTSGKRVGLIHHSISILVAIGLGLLTYKWPAVLLLFTLALLWFGILFQRILLRVAARVGRVQGTPN
jgi:membrane protein insertase Oxa1/YidC/SpoIIIJ